MSSFDSSENPHTHPSTPASLSHRVIKTSHDARLDDLLSTIPGMATFWLISFLWGWLVISPQTMLAGSAVDVPLGRWGKAAAGVAVLGILIEAAADFSKWAFKVRRLGLG